MEHIHSDRFQHPASGWPNDCTETKGDLLPHYIGDYWNISTVLIELRYRLR
jgi:hypothetical protein